MEHLQGRLVIESSLLGRFVSPGTPTVPFVGTVSLVGLEHAHYRGSILSSPQGSRTLVQRFTLQRPIHRFRQPCFAHIPGDHVLRWISHVLLLQLGHLLRDIQHASLHTPTSQDVPALTPTVTSDFSSFSSLFVLDAKGGENQRGQQIFDAMSSLQLRFMSRSYKKQLLGCEFESRSKLYFM